MYNKSSNMYNTYKQKQEQEHDGVSVIPQELCSGTLFRLRKLYLMFNQNTDVVSSINFRSPGVGCLMIILFILSRLIKVYVT